MVLNYLLAAYKKANKIHEKIQVIELNASILKK